MNIFKTVRLKMLNGGILSGWRFGALIGIWLWFCKRWDPVPDLIGGACCFSWVSRLGTYRDGTAVGNATNIVCISTPCSQRFVLAVLPLFSSP